MPGAMEAKTGYPAMIEIKNIMQGALEPAPGRLEEMVRQIWEKSGKMLRPRLLLACAALTEEQGGYSRKELLETAAAVELIHTASLIHDDIIDEADRRRSIETLHLRWGAGAATLAGDLLLARAFALLSLPGSDGKLLCLAARAVSLLCRGELVQMNLKGRWDLTEREYYWINYLKTAQFIAACCEGGACIAGGGASCRRLLHKFGVRLGQCFQIVDDILDYAAGPELMGKPAGNDLVQGRSTLPLIHLFARRKEYLKLVRMLPRGRVLPRDLQEKLRRAVRENGSLAYAAASAGQKQAEALELLRCFPPSRGRLLLTEITEAVMDPVPAEIMEDPLI